MEFRSLESILSYTFRSKSEVYKALNDLDRMYHVDHYINEYQYESTKKLLEAKLSSLN